MTVIAIRQSEAVEQTQKRIAEGGADDLKEKLDRYQRRTCDASGTGPHRQSTAGPLWTGNFHSGLRLPRLGEGVCWLRIPQASHHPRKQPSGSMIRSSRERLLTSLEVWFVMDGARSGFADILGGCRSRRVSQRVPESRVTNWLCCLKHFEGSLSQSQPVWFAIGQGTNRKMDRSSPGASTAQRTPSQTEQFSTPHGTWAALDEANDKESAPRRCRVVPGRPCGAAGQRGGMEQSWVSSEAFG